jgi:hypothetical protein
MLIFLVTTQENAGPIYARCNPSSLNKERIKTKSLIVRSYKMSCAAIKYSAHIHDMINDTLEQRDCQPRAYMIESSDECWV